MSISLSIIIGVVSGIITYLLLSGFIKIFNNLFIPWYQSVIYHGRKIEGTWHGYLAKIENGEYIKEGSSNSTIYLKQNANKITGERLITKQESGEECRKLFVINGLFHENNLTIDLKVKDQSRMGGGTCVMSLTEDGRKMKGKHTYVSSYDSKSIFARDEIWIRSDNK